MIKWFLNEAGEDSVVNDLADSWCLWKKNTKKNSFLWGEASSKGFNMCQIHSFEEQQNQSDALDDRNRAHNR